MCRTCAYDVLDLGVCDVTTEYGNTVKAYDVERTLCDLVRGQSTPDSQLVSPAMRAYVRSKNRDPAKLVAYSRSLGVEKKKRNYLQVLLREASSMHSQTHLLLFANKLLLRLWRLGIEVSLHGHG